MLSSSQKVATTPIRSDPDILRQSTERLIPLARILNDRLKDGPWLDGDHFTFADIACGHILHRYHTLDWARPHLQNLSSYYERLQTRSAYRENAMVSYEALRGSY